MKAKLSRGRWAAGRACVAALLVACCGALLHVAAQTQAAISGRVTDGERGLPGVSVALYSSEPRSRGRASTRTKTDGEGRYRFDVTKPGRYQVLPQAPAHVGNDRGDGWPPGSKLVNVLAGDTIEDVDFRLTRGGVVTGRVTDADGLPVVGEGVNVSRVDPPADDTVTPSPVTFRPPTTDDRGVYRAYGLPPGRYRVSVGQDGRRGGVRVSGPRRYYQRTFHPNAIDEAEARVVEVTAGGEAYDVDITVGRPSRTFKAAGRVVSAETGQAAPGVRVSYGPVYDRAQRVSAMAGATTDARGEFQLEGLTPGRYAAFASPSEGADWYADPVPFEVAGADAGGVELRLRRGVALSGVVHIDGLADRAAAARMLSRVRLVGISESQGRLQAMEQVPSTQVAPDGSFHFGSVKPGRLRISLDSAEGGLFFERIEVAGAPAREWVQVVEGAQLTGVRVVLLHGAAAVRGQVAPAGGFPPGTRVIIFARRTGGDSRFGRTAQADARGRFQFERLPAGPYEFQARGFAPDGRRFESRPQQGFVADGGEQQVMLTLEPVVTPGGNPVGP